MNPNWAFVGILLPAMLAVELVCAQDKSLPNDWPYSSPSRYQAGATKVNPKDGQRYVWIHPGNFMMGCSPWDLACLSDEKPTHRVSITRGFWIGQTPVTVAAYKRFAEATGQQMPSAPDFNRGWANLDMPIVRMTWDKAQLFCAWMGGRLPAEAQWEYAARGGNPNSRYGDMDSISWYRENSDDQTHAVAQKQANNFGLYDMLGNVWEWVNDHYDKDYYTHSPAQDPPGPSGGQEYVLRGGSWYDGPDDIRVSNRLNNFPIIGNDFYGFRCVAEAF